MRLNAAAKETLRDHGVTQVAWARWRGWPDGKWHGDACGCSDDRCIGYHHDEDDECGCLPVLLLMFKAECSLEHLGGAP